MIRQTLKIIEKSLDNSCSSSLSGYVNWLATVSPVFSVKGSQVKIITQPDEFYSTLIEKCKQSEKRILLTSLYLGNGPLSQNLVRTLDNRLRKVGSLDVNFLLDANRGSRGSNSSRDMLLPLVKSHPNCKVNMYHTPTLRGPLRYFLPQRYNELIGLQHMKVYLFDDDVIISGANLSEDYFTNRQDRYMVISGCKELADFYWELIKRISSVSFSLDSNDNLIPGKVHPYKTPYDEYIHVAKEVIWNYCVKAVDKSKVQPGHDTWLFPVVELPPLGVHQDSSAMHGLLECAPVGCRVTLSTGYFNLTEQYCQSIINNPGSQFRILMAHPSANGFHKAKGIAGGIPYAYTAIASQFLSRAPSPRVGLMEYSKRGWTYHVKGLWLTPPFSKGPAFTVIGSSNFGVRSVQRDLESSVTLVTANPELRQALRQEEELHLDHCSEFDSQTPLLPSRKPPFWVKAILSAFRSFF